MCRNILLIRNGGEFSLIYADCGAYFVVICDIVLRTYIDKTQWECLIKKVEDCKLIILWAIFTVTDVSTTVRPSIFPFTGVLISP